VLLRQGFNLRLQRAVRSGWPSDTLRPAGVHLVSPSFWAFRGGEARARSLAHTVDEMLCVLPFEPPLLQRVGVAASFVGHPVLEDCEWRDGQWRLREAFAPPCSDREHQASTPLLCVLLGSREQEVARHAPLFGEALQRLRETAPGLRLLLPTLPPLRSAVTSAAERWAIPFQLADGADAASRCVSRLLQSAA
jgi:lipid-A-disaccharide synthase